jgi:hypothetical protein
LALKQGPSDAQLREQGLGKDREWGIVAVPKANWDPKQYTAEAGMAAGGLPELRNGHHSNLPSEVNAAALNELSNLNEKLRKSRATLREIDRELAFFEEKRRSILSTPNTSGDNLDAFLNTGQPREGRIQRLDQLRDARRRERVAQAAIVALDEQRFATYSDKLRKQGKSCLEKAIRTVRESVEAVIRANDIIDTVLDSFRGSGIELSDHSLAYEPLRQPALLEKGRRKAFGPKCSSFDAWKTEIKKAGY